MIKKIELVLFWAFIFLTNICFAGEYRFVNNINSPNNVQKPLSPITNKKLQLIKEQCKDLEILYDDMRNSYIIQPNKSNLKRSVNQNNFGFVPSVGIVSVDNQHYVLISMQFYYTGGKWKFLNEMLIKADNDLFTSTLNTDREVRGNYSVYVSETCSLIASSQEIPYLVKIVNSKNIKCRLSGGNGDVQRYFSAQDLKMLTEALLAYTILINNTQ